MPLRTMPFSGVGRWVCQKLQPIVDSMEHMIRDSRELVHQLRQLVVGDDEIFLKMDVADFYPTGSQKMLVSSAKAMALTADKSLIDEVVHFLTYHQYIELHLDSNRMALER